MPHLRLPTQRTLFSSLFPRDRHTQHLHQVDHKKSKMTSKFAVGSIFLLVLILAACGGSATNSATSTTASSGMPAADGQVNHVADSAKQVPAAAAPDQLKMPKNVSQQHLIKTLNVTMEAKDTRQVANTIQTWIGNTDPEASSVGTNYNQVSDGVYNITISFSVEYTLYPKIYSYLSNYPLKDGGHLLALNETVQDVSNEYVDTQARIKNYQNELVRLRSLMQTTGSLNDVVALEQRISEVEGNIESTQAHLNSLTNQTTMYTINLTIQPLGSATPPIQPNSGWNIGQTLRDAFSASLAFAQGLLSFIIWLLAFSVYIIPIILLILLYRRYRASHPLVQPAQPLYYRATGPVSPHTQTGPIGNRPAPNRATSSQQPIPAETTPEEENEPENTSTNPSISEV